MEIGRKIVAVGRNYEDHAREMGSKRPTVPLLFLKPTSSYIHEGSSIEIPAITKDVHHEVELGVVIGRVAKDVPMITAMDYIAGYVLALDLTARDLQAEAKKGGLPWSVSKGFDTFTPVSKFLPRSTIPDPADVEIWCKVDGELRQKGSTKDMIFSIPELISYASSVFTLEQGDVILTGTPAGVGPIRPGQVINAGITNVVEMTFPVTDRPVTNTFLYFAHNIGKQ
eukprot:CAMPEP_0184659670 /NCGR_PEP_ID=MMETSP0308-20130426/30627_1 /TAXON_ID=38269 /ORGANISM="Gloeochaete witrockiana, Strain SAG 46.84" /LENGTH=225 /DNA_ID=CAMNT_0027099685 /DNA_START=166 /DNA_END=843 /DNA_ORIENTATION=-